jgi:hypothetical protein
MADPVSEPGEPCSGDAVNLRSGGSILYTI